MFAEDSKVSVNIFDGELIIDLAEIFEDWLLFPKKNETQSLVFFDNFTLLSVDNECSRKTVRLWLKNSV
jgi:hypothetical protein